MPLAEFTFGAKIKIKKGPGFAGPWKTKDSVDSLPNFINLMLFGKTILVVNIKFELFLGHPLSECIDPGINPSYVDTWMDQVHLLLTTHFGTLGLHAWLVENKENHHDWVS